VGLPEITYKLHQSRTPITGLLVGASATAVTPQFVRGDSLPSPCHSEAHPSCHSEARSAEEYPGGGVPPPNKNNQVASTIFLTPAWFRKVALF